MQNLEIQIINNREHGYVVSSRVIAEQLNKEHSKVIRSIEQILAEPNVASLIYQTEYKDLQGKPRKEYLLTKDGFILYMFNIQGYNDFKMAYINRFNELEKQNALMLPQDYPSALRALALSYEQNQTLLLENREMKPKADYFDELVERNQLTNFRDTAKQIGVKQNELIERLTKDGYIYRDQMNRIKPYAEYGEAGKKLFALRDFVRGERAGTQTLVTPKGKETFRLLYSAREAK